MNTELEQRLRADMDRATQGVRVPPGLALKAYQQHRKRTMTVRAAGAAAVLTAGALTVAGVSGAFGHQAGGQQVRTTAYVISRVERALAAPRMNNMIGHTRTMYPAGVTLRPAPGGLNGVGTPGTGSPQGAEYEVVWAYHHISKFSAFTVSGRHIFDERLIIGQGSLATTAVSYPGHTWWTATQPFSPPRGAPPASCLPGGQIRLNGGAGGGWPGLIRSQLACGAYTVVGRQAIGGVNALEITGSSGQFKLWVNPATYLPVRLQLGGLQTDFQWLSPTPAGLAMLNLPVPAGFHRVPPP